MIDDMISSRRNDNNKLLADSKNYDQRRTYTKKDKNYLGQSDQDDYSEMTEIQMKFS